MAENPADIAQYQNDHDLLILLNERVGALTAAVTNRNSDFEMRIRILEQQRWMFAGGATVVSVIASYALSIFF